MKKASIIIGTTIFIFLGVVLYTNAGHHGHSMFSSNLSDYDTNSDQAISFEEYAEFHSEKLRWGFNALDTDNDQLISQSEWDEFLIMHGMGEGYQQKQES